MTSSLKNIKLLKLVSNMLLLVITMRKFGKVNPLRGSHCDYKVPLLRDGAK